MITRRSLFIISAGVLMPISPQRYAIARIHDELWVDQWERVPNALLHRGPFNSEEAAARFLVQEFRRRYGVIAG